MHIVFTSFLTKLWETFRNDTMTPKFRFKVKNCTFHWNFSTHLIVRNITSNPHKTIALMLSAMEIHEGLIHYRTEDRMYPARLSNPSQLARRFLTQFLNTEVNLVLQLRKQTIFRLWTVNLLSHNYRYTVYCRDIQPISPRERCWILKLICL